MIPIISILNIISGIFFAFICFRIYLSYKKDKKEQMKNFFMTFFYLSLLLILIGTPGILVEDSDIIGFIFSVYPFIGVLAIAHLGSISMSLIGWKKAGKIFFRVMVVLSLIVFVTSALNAEPAEVARDHGFIYWEDPRTNLMNMFVGLSVGLPTLMAVILFVISAVKASTREARIKMLLIAGGLVASILMSVANFILEVWFDDKYAIDLAATSLNIMSAVLIMSGIYYKPKEKKEWTE